MKLPNHYIVVSFALLVILIIVVVKMAEAVAEDYRSSLADLNFNSKPHINMLTMLAEDNVKYASLIVDTIVNHIKSVPSDLKLPSLYLVDSIMKNVGGKYIAQFSKHMIELFSSVFEKVEEATRSALYKLRQTWNEILPKPILYGIDCAVNSIDPAWPITAQVTAKSIHVNPKFVSGPASQAAKNLLKGAEIKKKQEEMLKMIQEKKEREDMLKLIEEKRAQLRILEAKKLEQLQQAAQKGLGKALLVQEARKNVVNHRDPRLKKAAALIASESGKVLDKSNSTNLQSVVVIPSGEHKNMSVTTNLSPRTSPTFDKPTINSVRKASHPSELAQTLLNHVQETFLNPVKEEEFKSSVAGQPHKNSKVLNKKRTLSPDKSASEISVKKSCNERYPVNNSKSHHLVNDNGHSHKSANKRGRSESKPINKLSGKEEIDTTKDNCMREEKSEKQFIADPRLPQPSLFLGAEDKDYRKIARMVDNSKFKTESSNPPNSKSVNFPQRDQLPVNMHCEEKENDMKAQFHAAVENLRQTQPSPTEPANQTVSNSKVKMEPPLSHNTDLNQPTDPRKLPPLPLTQSFKLDGKDRIIHFVDKRAFAFMDDNEPHELSFIGSARNIFVEGLLHPFILGFDGKELDFEIEGEMNKIQFGTPSREIYINHYPYEVQFGGPPLVVVLEDNKSHRIGIDGPPPQVLISEKPAFELLEAFNRMKGGAPHKAEQKNTSSSEDVFPSQDVDMRVKSNPLKPPAFFESTSEKLKDVDWRHVPVSQGNQSTWGLRPNSAETVKSGVSINSTVMTNAPFGPQERFPAPSSAPFPRLGDGYNCINKQSSDSIPPLNIPWIEPNFMARRPPPPERQLMDSAIRNVAPLLPPPGLPPSLSTLPPPPPLPNLPPVDVPPPPLPNLPPVDVRPPAAWEPLRPPPMFNAPVPVRPKIPLLPTPMPHLYTAPDPTSSMNLLQEPPPEPPRPLRPSTVDVGSIFEKLVAAGIITKKTEDSSEDSASKKAAEEKKENSSKEDIVIKVDFSNKFLRRFNLRIISALYEGSQCATCGMRFKDSQGDQYGRHLDWHFRMNRREKDGAKKAFSRRPYLTNKEWLEFTEVEEEEERAPSYFELQADGVTLKKDVIEKVHSVRASECETEKCSVCTEQFQLFWVEEEEEWHLRNAVRHDGEVYHPACYEDFIKASQMTTSDADVSKEDVSEEVKEDSAEPMESEDTEEQEESNTINVPIKEEPAKEEINKEESTSAPGTEEDTMEVEGAIVKEEPLDMSSPPGTEEDNLKVKGAIVKEEPVDMESTEVKDILVKEEPIIMESTMKVEDIIVKEEPIIMESTIKVEDIIVNEEPVDEELTIASENAGLSHIIIYMKDEFFSDDEMESTPTKTEPMPTETESTPTETESTPTETESIPTETECTPAETESTPDIDCKTTSGDKPDETKVEETKVADAPLPTADDESEGEEFRPPTPDPRFEVLPPTLRGTELSALCTIM